MDDRASPQCGVDGITVDDREVPSGIVEALQARGWVVQTRRLICGDCRIGQEVLVERKTGMDFAASIIDGRLFRQAGRLRKQGLRPAFVVEGDPFRTRVGIDPAAIRGAIVSVSLIWQVPVIFSQNLEETVEILGVMASQVHRLIDLPVQRCGYRPKRTKRRQLYVLQGLSGIGPRRAHALLTRFKTLRGVFRADRSELSKVRGIGKTGARRLADLFDAAFFPADPNP